LLAESGNSGGFTRRVLSAYPVSGNEGPSNGHNVNDTSGVGHSDAEVDGVPIPGGRRVMLHGAATNRDLRHRGVLDLVERGRLGPSR
jgi:hypothetical protein